MSDIDVESESFAAIARDRTFDSELGVYVHDAAAIFAMIPEDEFELLKRNIGANGLLDPVVMIDGAILDGRNRWRACQELGIEPTTREWEPLNDLDSPEGFVVSKNIMRRHISKSQRAAHAARLYGQYLQRRKDGTNATSVSKARDSLFRSPAVATETWQSTVTQREAGNPVRSLREEVAESLGVSKPYLGDAYSLMNADPQRFSQVERGTLTLQSALNQHCAEHHRNGTLLTESKIREGVKRKWLNSRPGLGTHSDKPAKQSAGNRKKRPPARLSDVREQLSAQQIAALLRKERAKSGLDRSMVPVTLEITFANADVYEEVHRSLLKDDRILRVRVTNHLDEPRATDMSGESDAAS